MSIITTVMNRIGWRSYERRQYERVKVCLACTLHLEELGYGLSGYIVELSCGGLRFRQPLSFVMKRNDQRVVANVSGYVLPGIIVATSSLGYGLKFDKLLDLDAFESLIAEGHAARSEEPGEQSI